MILQERKWETCDKCGKQHMIQEETHGCDTCGKEIEVFDSNREMLDVGVFSKAGPEPHPDFINTARHFCSWDCLFEKLPKLCRECDQFITLPYLSFDNTTPGTTPADFWEAVLAYGDRGI